GYLLAMGSQRDLGAYRVAELCGLAAYAAYERAARNDGCLLGAGRLAGHQLRFPGCKHVPVRPAFLRRAVSRKRFKRSGPESKNTPRANPIRIRRGVFVSDCSAGRTN